MSLKDELREKALPIDEKPFRPNDRAQAHHQS